MSDEKVPTKLELENQHLKDKIQHLEDLVEHYREAYLEMRWAYERAARWGDE